ncbi:MAG TPA: ATP-binding protein [Gaiellaceae bacterium]|nr:ATP-binding protein [Gaiellaceae bacterium]
MTRRLLLGYLGVTLFVLLALEVPLGVQYQRSERHDVEVKVERDASVISFYAEDAVQSGNHAQLVTVARFAYSYAKSAGTRVVIVDKRGFALVDTSARVPGAESFASRPEIAAALQNHIASGTRSSATLNERLLYVAVPVGSGGVVNGAVRITYPMTSVDTRILHYWLLLAAIASVVLAAAALVGVRLARFVTRPLRRLEDTAAAVGAGKLDARAPELEGPPEVRSLSRVFNETVVKLEQLLRVQQEFVADASHELRTPLTALRLRLENLEPRIDDDGRRDLDAAVHEVERLGEIVETLLALARADAGAAPASAVDLEPLLRERVEVWRALAEEKGVELAAEPGPGLTVRAGPQRLAQVLDNLLANALEASPRASTVTVSVHAAGSWAELHVRDEGPGLTAEQRARAFDRFWRAGSGHGGSGLGLAIVKRLVEADEGRVELTAAAGGGIDAVVHLRLV